MSVLTIMLVFIGSLLSGKVVDSSGDPIPNVVVSAELSQVRTATDVNGFFTLRLNNHPSDSVTLVFQHIAYIRTSLRVPLLPSDSIKIVLNTKTLESENVVVTATRTWKDIEDVAIPIRVIGKEQVARSAVFRLDQVLVEQAGLTLVPDHGNGLQVQGFDPDYTMILVDGEPLVGRVAGTLDLSRISLGNIERIEMVKGPSSALWGSEALAGVINIITSRPDQRLNVETNARYGTNNLYDISARVSGAGERSEHSLFANVNASEGFDLNRTLPGPTAPPFQNVTLQGKSRFAFLDNGFFSVAGRLYSEVSTLISPVSSGEENFTIEDRQHVEDWSINPVMGYQWKNLRLEGRFYRMHYINNTNAIRLDTDATFSESSFNQQFQKSELQMDWVVAASQVVTVGSGHIRERVSATRYRQEPRFDSFFTFVQHDWSPTAKLSLISGLRWDGHSEYGSQLSPKLSAKYNISNDWKIKVSAGRGFKAPDFRQLLLNFVNPQAGYAVFGTRELVSELESMRLAGDIQRIFIDPTSVASLRAESSWAFNIGTDVNLTPRSRLSMNLFHNNVRNLIDTRPIAQRVNNANVFSYINVDNVIMQGAELDWSFTASEALRFSLGYQFLDARDQRMVRSIRQGDVFRPISGSPGRFERVRVSEYGGLVNRSRHMANAMMFYTHEPSRLGMALRGQYRGRFGFGDLNQNGIIDSDNEYAPGYMLLNATLTYSLPQRGRIFVSGENLFNQTNPQLLPFLPGRLFFVGLNFTLKPSK